MKKIILIILCLVVSIFIVYQPIKKRLMLSPVISTGVSTDGRYVITAHASRKTIHFSDTYVVLWDTQTKTKKILAEGINPFSAYFIPDSHEFIWQDKHNVVHIQNVEGKEVLSFEHFPVWSQVMSADKQTYLSTSEKRNIYSGYGKNLKPVLNDSFAGSKPMYLSMVGDYFLSAGYWGSFPNEPVSDTNITESPIIDTGKVPANFKGVTLWDKTTLQPIARLNGNGGKTFALLSPDGKWAISGGENWNNYMWSTNNLEQRLRLAEPKYGIYIPAKDGLPATKDDSQLLAPPPELKMNVLSASTVAYTFLTETDFIQLGHIFEKGIKDRLAPLYTVGDPWIKAYVDLQAEPMPSLNSYMRGLSIASSYKAHVLVTGQAFKGGINVYQYHPDKKELERTWVGSEFKYW